MGEFTLTKIFIVEDNQSLIELITTTLKKWQYQVTTIKDWNHVATEVTAADPDLILFDITLPTFDGFYWMQKVRQTCQAPIIVISAADIDSNIMRAINLGADDYIMKPFSTSVLLAKIQALLRRAQSNDSDQLRWGNNHFNALTNELTNQYGTAFLSPTEGALLTLLIKQVNHTVPKEKLLEWLWQGGKFLNDNTLNVNISRLRAKLATVKLDQNLRTERGVGYRLVNNHEQ